MMSKLTDFYAHKASLKEEDQSADLQWEQMEDQLLKEEMLPELIEHLKAVLSKVKSPLMFSGFYDPNGGLSVSFTRNCLQISTQSPMQAAVQQEEEETSDEVITDNSAVSEPEDETANIETKYKKSKSIGFSVSFRDGEICHEPKAVNTWIKALKKIGLENICNNRSKHRAWHRVAGQDICIVERTETIRESDGRSPQTLVDGFYVMTQLSNEAKVDDLMALAEFLPKLGIKVIWDNETTENDSGEGATTPFIDETLPIKEQFRSYLASKRTQSTANSYTATLDNAVREWVNKEVDKDADSVFSYTTVEDVRICIDMLNSSPEYVAEKDRKHHSMSAAINQYLLFIEEKRNLHL